MHTYVYIWVRNEKQQADSSSRVCNHLTNEQSLSTSPSVREQKKNLLMYCQNATLHSIRIHSPLSVVYKPGSCT